MKKAPSPAGEGAFPFGLVGRAGLFLFRKVDVLKNSAVNLGVILYMGNDPLHDLGLALDIIGDDKVPAGGAKGDPLEVVPPLIED